VCRSHTLLKVSKRSARITFVLEEGIGDPKLKQVHDQGCQDHDRHETQLLWVDPAGHRHGHEYPRVREREHDDHDDPLHEEHNHAVD